MVPVASLLEASIPDPPAKAADADHDNLLGSEASFASRRVIARDDQLRRRLMVRARVRSGSGTQRLTVFYRPSNRATPIWLQCVSSSESRELPGKERGGQGSNHLGGQPGQACSQHSHAWSPAHGVRVGERLARTCNSCTICPRRLSSCTIYSLRS